MRLQLIAISLWCAVATADEMRPAPHLDFQLSIGKVRRVLVDGKLAKDWIDADRLRVRASGFKKVEITFEHNGRTDKTVQYIGFARGVEVQLQDHNGAIVVAQPPGKRCGRVEGSNKPWRLCDGRSGRIPVAETFELDCPNPIDLRADHMFSIDGDTSIESPVFVPTLPGLYRARYRRGRISVSYETSDCAGARALEQ